MVASTFHRFLEQLPHLCLALPHTGSYEQAPQIASRETGLVRLAFWTPDWCARRFWQRMELERGGGGG